jgi:hypothetical protein
MGIRSLVACVAAAAVVAACGEQQASDRVAGPSLTRHPTTDPAACDPGSLNGLITDYFPGSSRTAIKSLKDAMVAAPNTPTARDRGFAILDSIGALSRLTTVDAEAGSALAQGVIKCMFDAKSFTPTFPSNAIYDFAPSLDPTSGGAFYTRGANTGSAGPVQGGLTGESPVDVLSGVNPLSGTWTSVLAGNTGSEGRVLIYGYPVTTDPLVYEWATIPPAAVFNPGAVVAICDGANADVSMVHESTIGVLAYNATGPICSPPISLVLQDTGWGPRALAARLARTIVSAVTPQPLQATMKALGTGGTASTFKSKFSKQPVTAVALTYTVEPPKVIRKDQTVTAEVRATTTVDGVTSGVNAYTVTKGSAAGYASFSFRITKTGGLILMATATDDSGSPIGVVGRNGQTFTTDQIKTNVKP